MVVVDGVIASIDRGSGWKKTAVSEVGEGVAADDSVVTVAERVRGGTANPDSQTVGQMLRSRWHRCETAHRPMGHEGDHSALVAGDVVDRAVVVSARVASC